MIRTFNLLNFFNIPPRESKEKILQTKVVSLKMYNLFSVQIIFYVQASEQVKRLLFFPT